MSRRLLALVLVLAACGGADVTTTTITLAPATTSAVTTSPPETAPPTTSPATTTPIGAADCPEVLAVEFRQSEPGVFTVSTTVRSVDIEGVSFADAWEVRDLEGNVLGTRILAHPHANEQPFTRSQTIELPEGTTVVYVEGRDQGNGWSGQRFEFALP